MIIKRKLSIILVSILCLSSFTGCSEGGNVASNRIRTIPGDLTYSSVLLPDSLGDSLVEYVTIFNDSIYYTNGNELYSFNPDTKKHSAISGFTPSEGTSILSMSAGKDQIWLAVGNENSLSLRAIDENGFDISLTDGASIYGDGPYSPIRSMKVDDSGNLYLLINNQIIILDAGGSEISRIEPSGVVLSLVSDGKGTVRTVVIEGIEKSLYKINADRRTLSGQIILPQTIDSVYDGGGKYDLYYKDNTLLYGLDINSKESTEILEWLSLDIDPAFVPFIIPIYQDDFFCVVDRPSSGKGLLFHLTTEEIDRPEKTSLKLAVFNPGFWLLSAVSDYNLNNDEYRIEIMDYQSSSYGSTFGHTDNIEQMKLITEITAGNIPDIIDVSVFPVERFAKKGLFEDLYPFIDSDHELSREDILENVLEAIEIDGHLYHTISEFHINTVMGRTDMVGSDIGWTIDEMKLLDGSAPNSLFYSDRNSLLDRFSVIYAKEFIDWEIGSCNFNSDDFVYLLELAKTHIDPNEITTEWINMGEAYRSGSYLLHTWFIRNILDIQEFRHLFDTEFTFKGYPIEKGSGNYIISSYSPQLAITSASEHKGAAWSFVRTLLTEEYQTPHNSMYLPTNKASMDAFLERQMTPEFTTDENGNEVELPKNIFLSYEGYFKDNNYRTNSDYINVYAASQEDLNKFVELLSSCNRIYRADTAVYNIIAEECSVFFAGDKSAKDTADIIQSRVSLYVSEQS